MKAKCFTSIGKSTNVDCEVTDSGQIQRKHMERVYFASACAPSPFHWHFQQAYDALICDLYLPGLSGLLNGIEASLRTTITALKGLSLGGDLGTVMHNRLLQSAEEYGMNIQLLAFPSESDFREKLSTRNGVKLVQLRNDICHGNFQRFVRDVEGVDFFSPECLGGVSAQLLQMSFDWTRHLCDFYHETGWRSSGSVELIVPDNPLKRWLTS